MPLKDFGSFLKLQVVTSDAYILGEIHDMRYDPISWSIKGFKVKSSKNAASVLSAGYGKSMLFLPVGDYTVNDVILVDSPLESLRGVVSADNDVLPAISFLRGKKVVSSDGVIMGTLEDMVLEEERWIVPTFRMKVDKGANEILGMKRSIFSKTVSGIPSTDIASVAEVITLYPKASELQSSIILD